jgi:drug/metabolite transporter (DMT)-like permease
LAAINSQDFRFVDNLKERRLHRRGIVFGILAGCFMSTVGILIRQIEAASEWQIIFYRSVTLAMMLICIIWVKYRTKTVHQLAESGIVAVIAGLCLAIAFTGFILSITHTTVANTLFLLTSAPILTAIIARIVIKEPVRTATWIFMTVALMGIIIMVINGLAIGSLFGNLMGLLAALGHSCFAVVLRWGQKKDMIPAVFFAGVFAAIVSTFMVGGFSISLHDLLVCISLGVLGLGLGLILFTWASRLLPAAELVLLALVEVILGPVWVWIGVGESPSALTLIGGVIMLGAIVGHALTGMRRSQFPPVTT